MIYDEYTISYMKYMISIIYIYIYIWQIYHILYTINILYIVMIYDMVMYDLVLIYDNDVWWYGTQLKWEKKEKKKLKNMVWCMR